MAPTRAITTLCCQSLLLLLALTVCVRVEADEASYAESPAFSISSDDTSSTVTLGMTGANMTLALDSGVNGTILIDKHDFRELLRRLDVLERALAATNETQVKKSKDIVNTLNSLQANVTSQLDALKQANLTAIKQTQDVVNTLNSLQANVTSQLDALKQANLTAIKQTQDIVNTVKSLQANVTGQLDVLKQANLTAAKQTQDIASKLNSVQTTTTDQMDALRQALTKQSQDLQVKISETAANAQLLVPVGTVLAYAGTTAPSGFLMCEGQVVSRSQYNALFGIIGTAFGQGDGTSTQFVIPDLRGYFIRGRDSRTNANEMKDPDVSSRASQSPGGNTGNRVGSVQQDALGSHSHTAEEAAEHTHSFSVPPHTHAMDHKHDGVIPMGVRANAGAGDSWGTPIMLAGGGQYGLRYAQASLAGLPFSTYSASGRTGDDGAFSGSTGPAKSSISVFATGGKETRPKNVYMNYIIKT